MEIVSGLSFNDCSSIFFNGPPPLLDALSSAGDGLFVSTRAEHESLGAMVDTAKLRAGLARGNTVSENIFIEINYRILEKKNALLFDIQQSMIGTTDEMIERLLHEVVTDKVNEVYIFDFFKKIDNYNDRIFLYKFFFISKKISKKSVSFFRICRSTRCFSILSPF